jgi:hypothetical protein
MNVAVAIVGLTLGQPPAAPAAQDYYPFASRTIKLPIKYERDRKGIRQVKLYVARNGENTWYQESAVSPDRDSFTYFAKEDGIYWFTMVEEDLQGKNVPTDLTRTPPDLKVVVDTIPPRVQFTNVKRVGEEVVAEWALDDKHPDDNRTQVHIRPVGSEQWKEVSLPPGWKSGVRFNPGNSGAIQIRVTAFDVAGNRSEGLREVAGSTGGSTSTTSMSPTTVVPPTTPVMPTGGSAAPIPPPDSLAPLSPSGPVAPIAPGTPPTVGGPPATPIPGNSVLPTAHPPRTSSSPAPVAVWSGNPPASTPTVEVSRGQTINYLAFDLGYEIESRGPSGISRVDLWVTRDDGRTWLKWSQSDGKGASVRVNLGVPGNPQPEGSYGFRVVPVSGAGLSEREPTAGDAPDMRVVVDVTAPQLDLFPPVGDPNNSNTLVIQWKAADKNFTDDPITIEWSDKPSGPWQPVAAANDLVQPASTATPSARRLPNTGSFAWHVPAGLPPRVYLKVVARDSAGNEKTVITRDPVLIDLVKPRAKVSGIVGPVGSPRP